MDSEGPGESVFMFCRGFSARVFRCTAFVYRICSTCSPFSLSSFIPAHLLARGGRDEVTINFGTPAVGTYQTTAGIATTSSFSALHGVHGASDLNFPDSLVMIYRVNMIF